MIKSRSDKSLTLLELIISIAIISIIVLGFTSLDIYSRHNVLQASRHSKVQNAISYALDHMTKHIGNAIGDSPVDTSDIDGNTAIQIRVDSNNNGELDGADEEIAYLYDSGSRQIWYCPECTDSTCTTCSPAWGADANIIAKDITSFSATSQTPQYNYVTVNLTGLWDAGQGAGQDNPEVTMQTGIKMFGVSTE